jgi:Ser/Thr protein kinase RdoA (MazF antagonist)
MNAAVFPADPRLPELAVACDPARMTALLRRRLRPRGGAAIEGCALEELRHRADRRTVLRYRVAVGGAARPHWWLTGLLYGGRAAPGRAAAVAEELRAVAPAPAEIAWEQPFESVALLPELGMVVQAFPFDRRLPALAPLSGGPGPELAALLCARAGLPAARIDGWTSELVRYRPQRCAVLRWTLTGCGGPHRFYVKLHAKDADLAAARDVPARAGGFAVSRPLLELPDRRLVAYAEAPGTPFDHVVFRGAGAAEAARVVGGALAALHRDAALPPRRFTAADERADVAQAAALVRWGRPDLERRVRRIQACIGRALRDVPPAFVHGDLKPDHVLLAGGRPALIDLDTRAAADPVLDPGKLLARLFGLALERPAAGPAARAASRALADAYFAAVPRDWRARLEPHYAAALLKLAASLLRRQAPGWPALAGALVAEADRATAGLAGPPAPTAAPAARTLAAAEGAR